MIAKLLYFAILFAVFFQGSASQNETDSRTDKNHDESDEKSNTSPSSNKESRPSCSTSSVSIFKKRFVHVWKIENFMQTLEIYGTDRFLEMENGYIEFNEDTVKGKWWFKLTNTKRYGYVAVYANHSYEDPKTIPQKLIQISLKYSSQKYRGSPFYSVDSLMGIESTLNQITNPTMGWANDKNSSIPCYCAPVLYTLSNTNRRNRHQGVELKYSSDFNTIRQQIPYSSFEFPIFQVFLSPNERISNKITEAEDLKLKFEIDVLYPEIVKEVSKSCTGH